LDDPMRRAGQVPWPALADSSDVFRVESIDILQGNDCVQDSCFVQMTRQGQLDQDTVDRRILVQTVYQSQQFALTTIARQTVQLAAQPRLLASPLLAADVDLASRMIADQNSGQTRRDSALFCPAFNLDRQFRADLGGYRLTIQNSGNHARVS
jgi:hypothetical protein